MVMKKGIGILNRLLLVVCALALAAVLFVPIWRIDLVAPQYPEGLFLLIHADKLAGNVDIINGLNHYIGMKTLHADVFVVFKVLPYLIGFFALLFLVAGIVGRRWLLNLTFVLFLLFGVIAMADFWKWEYDYGHNLNPDAAIKVPGMSYQPPLIGYKQLLNFSAYSMPDIGGWIFVGVGAIALTCVVLAWRNKKSRSRTVLAGVAAAMLIFTASSCNAGPQPLKTGVDQCSFCKMTLSDNRFGAEIITKKGRAFKFDDPHCLLAYLGKETNQEGIASIYFVTFEGDHSLIDAEKAFFLKSDQLQSPMGGNVAAFATKASLENASRQFKGSELSWKELRNK
jgi:copper chaperone NosL